MIALKLWLLYHHLVMPVQRFGLDFTIQKREYVNDSTNGYHYRQEFEFLCIFIPIL